MSCLEDNGSSWSTIVASTPNDGIHAWSVGSAVTANARIRVTSTTFATATDISDASFRIQYVVFPMRSNRGTHGGIWEG